MKISFQITNQKKKKLCGELGIPAETNDKFNLENTTNSFQVNLNQLSLKTR